MTIIEQEQKIDVVIHNAAHLFIGYSEAFTAEQIASSLNTNVLGAHRLNRAVLPFMRRQANGLILYVGSGITNVTAPFMSIRPTKCILLSLNTRRIFVS